MDVKGLPTPTPEMQAKQLSEARRPYENIAEGMETQFASHMIEQMRKTIPKETPDSSAQTYYNSIMDYEYAKKMAQGENGSIGMKKVILDQILPAHLKHRPTPKMAQDVYQQNESQSLVSSKELRHE